MKRSKFRPGIIVLGCLMLLSCKEVGRILGPEIITTDQNWEMRETEHLCIHFRPNSAAARDIEFIVSRLEEGFHQVVNYLQVQYRNKITFFVYSSLQDKEQNCGFSGSGMAWPSLESAAGFYESPQKYGAIGPHELVHIIVYWTVGMQTSVALDEGIAVAVTGYYMKSNEYPDGIPVHIAASQLNSMQTLKPVSSMFDNQAWETVHDQNHVLYYNQSGSFVAYLVECYGVQSFKQFYTRASANEYKNSFSQIYGISIDDFYQQWILLLSR